jgi:hypothetical protein
MTDTTTTATTVDDKAAERAATAKAVSTVANKVAKLLGADETNAFKRAELAYAAAERGLSLNSIANAIGRASAKLAHPTMDDETLNILGNSPEYRVTKATMSRWADSFGYPTRHGIPATIATVAATAKVLNNTRDAATVLDNLGATAAAAGGNDERVAAWLSGVREIVLASAAARDAARKAKADEAKAKAANGNREDDSVVETAPAVPASPEVVVQSVVDSLALATAMRDQLSEDQIEEIRAAVSAFVVTLAGV